MEVLSKMSVAGSSSSVNSFPASSGGGFVVNVPARGVSRGAGTSLDTGKQVDIGRDRGKGKELSSAEKWRRNRARRSVEHGQLVEALDKLGRGKKASQVLVCGRVTVYECQDCSGLAGRRGTTCKNRLCPYCQATRGARMAERLAPIVGAFARPALLTLTLKNGFDLGERFQHLRLSWSKLWRHKAFRAAFEGGFCFVETTWCEETGWHVHIHALVDGRMPQAEIVRHWEEVTGDSYIVWITAIRAVSVEAQLEAMKEAIKYPVKIGTVVPDAGRVKEYLDAMKGRRLAWGFGHCFGVVGQFDQEEKEAYKEAERIEQEVREGQERCCPHCGSVDGLEVRLGARPWPLVDCVLAGRGWWVRVADWKGGG